MKTRQLFHCLILIIFIIIAGCDKNDKDPDNDSLSITILAPTDITETAFTAHWSINQNEVQDILIELAKDMEFQQLEQAVMVDDPTRSSQQITNLHGATKYYYRLKVNTSDGVNGTSAARSAVTTYQSEEANVTSSDGLFIAGDLYYLNSNPEKSPAMILMGHFEINNMWKGEELFLDLVAQGFICYIFNVRGHGASEGWPIFEIVTVEELATFVREYASLDLEACYNYLRAHNKVDPDRIGLMGGSMGANLSLIGNGWDGVKVSVGLTNSRVGLENIGILSNVLFVVAKQDCNPIFCYVDEVEHLYNSAAEPKKKFVIDGEFHGLDMLVNPDVKPLILDWINARMAE